MSAVNETETVTDTALLPGPNFLLVAGTHRNMSAVNETETVIGVAVNEIDTVTAAAEVNEIVTVRDRGGGGQRGGAAELVTTELVTAELVTSPTCRVHFGGVHGCGDVDMAELVTAKVDMAELDTAELVTAKVDMAELDTAELVDRKSVV